MQHRSAFAKQYQRGVTALLGAVWLMTSVLCLMALDLGNLFWQKRQMQSLVDIAAMAGAEVTSAGCAVAQSNALNSARLNGLKGNDTVPTINCGNWDPDLGAVDASSQPPRYFRAGLGPFNAVKVELVRSVPYFFVFDTGSNSRVIRTEATATTNGRLASFSVGSSLLRVNGSSVLGSLLKGIGLDLSGTSLLSYDGLAQVKVTPGGLLNALGIPVGVDLGVGELNTLLAARQVSLGDVLNAVVSLAGRSDLLGLNATLLNAITAKLGVSSLDLPLGSGSDAAGGLFALIEAGNTGAGAALNVGVSALDLIYSAIGVATKEHALDVGLNVSLLGATITTRVAVVEPPSIAIGGVGAKAYTAQVRSYVRVALDVPLTIHVDLPIVLDAVTGLGELKEMCTPALRQGTTDRARIEVSGSILKTCVGQVAPADLFSKSRVCEDSLQNMNLLSVSVLGLPVLSVNNKIQLNALPLGPYDMVLAAGETQTTPVNPLSVGQLVSQLTNQLISLLTTGSGGLLGPLLSGLGLLLAPVLNILTSILQPLLDAVGNSVLTPLLQNVLGLNLGQVDVNLRSLNCSAAPMLVY